MNWNCAITEERLSDYLDGQLSPEEAEAFSAHRATCNQCEAQVREVGQLVARMQTLELISEPPHLARKILDATSGPRKHESGWRTWLAGISTLWQPRFALGAVAVVAILFFVLNSAGLRTSHLKRVAFNPADMVRTANRQAHLVYAHSAKYVNDLRVVYEIQSRLQPEAPPQAVPLPEPESHPPSSDPQQKSQTDPHHNRSEIRGTTFYAMLLPVLPSDDSMRSPR
ncbi:MAG: anti-sigma factor family protein [Candidatus Acidiferrales bacterium]